jgi:thiol-disulfide isomerase/thioredoxin
MKNLIIITAIVVFSITKMSAQSPAKSKADLAWEAMPTYDFKVYETDKFQHEKAYEIYKRKFLDAGLKFWNNFPNDKRRINWFMNITSFAEPGFWHNIDEGAKAVSVSSNGFYSTSIDQKLFKQWLDKKQQLKNALLNDPKVSASDKRGIKISEVALELSRSQNSLYRGDKKSFISRFKTAFEDAAVDLKEEDAGGLIRYGEQLILAMDKYGIDLVDLESIVKALNSSKYPAIQKWLGQKLALLNLQNEPFKLTHRTVDGVDVNLEKLRGKVILLDFWATTCSTCIARMPAIKAVYDKYKDQGFLVISSAYNPEMDKEKIIAIHHRIGADWPLMMVGGESDRSGVVAANSIGKQIWQQYGFSYVPQLLLLDKEGKLVMYNSLLLDGDFEPIVKIFLSK